MLSGPDRSAVPIAAITRRDVAASNASHTATILLNMLSSRERIGRGYPV